MNLFRDIGCRNFPTGSSFIAIWELDLVDANRFARRRQLHFSKFGTVAHSSPRRFEIAANSRQEWKIYSIFLWSWK